MINISSNKVIMSGSAIPSIADAPLDIRTRVNTIYDIYNIEMPYVGMVVYVIDEDKYYKVKSLKAKEVGNALIKNASVNTFEELLAVEKTVLSLQQQVEQLQSTINELVQVPEIVIANKNIESEMEYLNERTQDENVIGIVIDPYLGVGCGLTSNVITNINLITLNPNLEIVNDKKNIIKDIMSIDLRIEEKNIYNVYTNCYYRFIDDLESATYNRIIGCWTDKNYITRSLEKINDEGAIIKKFKSCSEDVLPESYSLVNLFNDIKDRQTNFLIHYSFTLFIKSDLSNIKLLEMTYSSNAIIRSNLDDNIIER